MNRNSMGSGTNCLCDIKENTPPLSHFRVAESLLKTLESEYWASNPDAITHT